MTVTIYMFLFLLGHALGDFYLQSKRTVKKKEQTALFVVIHAAAYTICFTVLLLVVCQMNLALFWLLLLIFSTHTIIDLAKRSAEKASHIPLLSKQSPQEYLFFIDQGLHIGSLILLSFLFYTQLTPRLWFVELHPIEMGWGVHPVILLMAFVYIIKPASMVIEKILNICNILPTIDTGFVNGGKIIGILERLLILFLLLLGQFSTIGLVIAAKSLARFRDLDDRKCAEYYIIGTFLSLVSVGAVALITIIN